MRDVRGKKGEPALDNEAARWEMALGELAVERSRIHTRGQGSESRSGGNRLGVNPDLVTSIEGGLAGRGAEAPANPFSPPRLPQPC